MPRKTVFDMSFADVYNALIQKAERKGRSRGEVDQVTAWITGYTPEQIDGALVSAISYGEFIADSPDWNPRSELITGKICGIQIEMIFLKIERLHYFGNMLFINIRVHINNRSVPADYNHSPSGIVIKRFVAASLRPYIFPYFLMVICRAGF